MSSAPETIKLIESVRQILKEKSHTQDYLRRQLNEYLPSGRRIKHAAQISRWLDTGSFSWNEPSGEIVLALQRFVREHSLCTEQDILVATLSLQKSRMEQELQEQRRLVEALREQLQKVVDVAQARLPQ